MIKNFLKISFILVLLFLANESFACFEFNNLTIKNQTDSDKAEIVKLQILLKSAGQYAGPVTGFYGGLTETSVKEIQRSENIPATGTIDSKTKEAICTFFYQCPFTANLKRNDISPRREIESLQAFLSFFRDVYPRKLVTGFYGSLTETAVKNFQKYFNISQTGQVDEQTRMALCQAFDSFKNQDVAKAAPVTSTPRAVTTTSSSFQSICIPFPSSTGIGQSVLFIPQTLGGSEPFTYQWSGDVKSNAKTATASFDKAGMYTIDLKVTDKSGNVSSSKCSVKVGDGLVDLNKKSSLPMLQIDSKGEVDSKTITNIPSDLSFSWVQDLLTNVPQKIEDNLVSKKDLEMTVILPPVVGNDQSADYSCNEITGRCVIVPYATGKYVTLGECNKECVKKNTLTRYSCQVGLGKCIASELGLYGSFSNCMKDCSLSISENYWDNWLNREYNCSAVKGDPAKTPDLIPFVASVRGIVSSGDIDHVFSDAAMAATGDCTEIRKIGGGVWDLNSKNIHIGNQTKASYQGYDMSPGNFSSAGSNHCFLQGEAIIEAGIANVGVMPAGMHTFTAMVGDPIDLPGDGSKQGVKLTHHLYPVTYTNKSKPILKDKIRNIWDYGYVSRTEERSDPYKYHYGIEFMGESRWPKSLDSSNIFYVPGIQSNNVFKTWFRFRCQDNKVHRIYFVADPPQYYQNSPTDILNPSYTEGQTDGKIMLYNILTRYSGDQSKVAQSTRWADKFNGEYTSFLPSKFVSMKDFLGKVDPKHSICMFNAPLAYNKLEDHNSSWDYKNNRKVYVGPGECDLPDYQDLKLSETRQYATKYFHTPLTEDAWYLMCEKNRETCNPRKMSGFFSPPRSLGSTPKKPSYIYSRHYFAPKDKNVTYEPDENRKPVAIGMVYETFDEWNNMTYIDIQCNCHVDRDGKPFCFGPELKGYTPAR